MMHTASGKLAIIRLAAESELSIRRTLEYMEYTCGAPQEPMPQGRIERYHRATKNTQPAISRLD